MERLSRNNKRGRDGLVSHHALWPGRQVADQLRGERGSEPHQDAPPCCPGHAAAVAQPAQSLQPVHPSLLHGVGWTGPPCPICPQRESLQPVHPSLLHGVGWTGPPLPHMPTARKPEACPSQSHPRGGVDGPSPAPYAHSAHRAVTLPVWTVNQMLLFMSDNGKQTIGERVESCK